MRVGQRFSFVFVVVGISFLSFQLCFATKDQKENGTPSELGMGYGDALVYGLVEGITEFLPISSTGHLVLTKEFLSSPLDDGAEEAINSYLIVIQGGAILAVILLYRRRVWSVALGFAAGQSEESVVPKPSCRRLARSELATAGQRLDRRRP